MWKKLKLFCTVYGNVKWCNCCGKHCGGSLKKLIVELSFDRGNPFTVYTYIKSLWCTLQIPYSYLSIAFIKTEQQKLTTWWSRNSTAEFKSKSIYGRVSEMLHTHVHSSILHNRQMLEVTDYVRGWTEIQMWYTYTMEYPYQVRKLWCLLQHGWTLKTWCWVKYTSHKKTTTVFHLYDVFRVVTEKWKVRMVVTRTWWEGGTWSCLMGFSSWN